MNIEIVNSTIVVTGTGQEPPELNPTLLLKSKIIPEDWDFLEPPISTPNVSIIKYKNGIVFVLDDQKFQLVDNFPPKESNKSLLPELAIKTLKIVSGKMKCNAIGINFKAIIKQSLSTINLVNIFLKDEVLKKFSVVPGDVGLRFVYDIENAVLRLSIDKGTLSFIGDKSKKEEGILIDANFHTDLKSDNLIKSLTESISMFSERDIYLQELAKKILD
jgi:hypothetical protein